MKKSIVLAGVIFLFLGVLNAQPDNSGENDIMTEKGLRDSILLTIQKTRDSINTEMEKKMGLLEKQITNFDKSLGQVTLSGEARIKTLEEKVKTIEMLEEASAQGKLSTYQANYQSAVINLVSMERELKPLYLFKSTQAFYSTLNQVANPGTYPGYSEWYKTFKTYIERNKQKEATLNVISQVLAVSGDIAQGAPVSGPLVQTLFVGMGNFIATLGKNQQILKDQSEKMFRLTMVLSQFTHEKDQIETEWEAINKELGDLKSIYDETLNHNLTILGIDKSVLQSRFTKENDANRRLVFLNELTGVVSETVKKEHSENSKKWKDKFFYEMQTVQSLKVRFGGITFRISQNLIKYQDLITKYKSSPELGGRMAELDVRLKELINSFDSSFDPLEYIKSADRMYQVE
ncbi:MAG: hypothetical protein K1X92_18125 [Bacteroidia bacterium]|nr:hypothetical protein [Bacteroidia bacterium]